MIKNQKCECHEEGIMPSSRWLADQYDPETELPFVVHEPGQCQCTNDLAIYIKADGSKAILCSNCWLSGDILLGPL